MYENKIDPAYLRSHEPDSVHHELSEIHQQILSIAPEIERVSVVMYDPESELIKTYADSTLDHVSFSHHEFPLKACTDLQRCAALRQSRVIDNIPNAFDNDNKHSRWLIEHGYLSSLTVPLYSLDQFIGFVFLNAKQQSYFTPEVEQALKPFSELINFVVNAEYSLLNAILTSAELTKALSSGYQKESGHHVERISRYAELIANGVAYECQLDDDVIENIHLFSRIHDIGKSSITHTLLLKPDRLENSERSVMQQHVENGIELIDQILLDLGSPTHPCIEVLKGIIACHQEFLDGSGYPQGLCEEQIPIPARIITVANIFDALTSHRPYKQACSVSSALLELEKMVASNKLDPRCVNALRKRQDYLYHIIKQFPEADPLIQN